MAKKDFHLLLGIVLHPFKSLWFKYNRRYYINISLKVSRNSIQKAIERKHYISSLTGVWGNI